MSTRVETRRNMLLLRYCYATQREEQLSTASVSTLLCLNRRINHAVAQSTGKGIEE